MNERDGGRLRASMELNKRMAPPDYVEQWKKYADHQLRTMIAAEMVFTKSESIKPDDLGDVEITAECWNFTLHGMAQHDDEVRVAAMRYARELLLTAQDITSKGTDSDAEARAEGLQDGMDILNAAIMQIERRLENRDNG